MEIKEGKKQKLEECERVFIAPSVKPFLALTMKEDTDVEDEFEEKSEDGKSMIKVQQKIKGRVFETEIVMEQDIDEESSIREEVKRTCILPLGTKLIWIEGQGYVAAKENFQTYEEIKETYNLVLNNEVGE